MSNKEPVICCICKMAIPVKTFPNGGTWEYGNNADPVANGRCCDECDNNVVIPERLAREEARQIADGVKNALKAMERVSNDEN